MADRGPLVIALVCILAAGCSLPPNEHRMTRQHWVERRAELLAERERIRAAAEAERAAVRAARAAARDPATEALREIKIRLVAGADVSLPELRRLAGSGDAFGAMALAERLEEVGDPADLGETAQLYASALDAGRGAAAYGLARVISRPEFVALSADLRGEVERALFNAAAGGDAEAMRVLTNAYLDGQPFDVEVNALDRLLGARNYAADGPLAIDLAKMLLLKGGGDPTAARLAQALVEDALSAADLASITAARNLQPLLVAAAPDGRDAPDLASAGPHDPSAPEPELSPTDALAAPAERPEGD